MSASEAFHPHETLLMKDPVTLTLLADRRMCPSLRDVNNLHDKWLVEKKGPSNGSAMFDRLEEVADDYNKNNADKGASVTFKGLTEMVQINKISSYPYAPH